MHHLFDVMPGDSAAKGTSQPAVQIGLTPKYRFAVAIRQPT
jgi:hypothetical protein